MRRVSSALIAGGLVSQAKDGEPLHRQLYRRIRDQILSGKLPPGERLPSTRTMAQDLALARNTVSQAFEQLIAEGYLEAERGSGTFVARELPAGVSRIPVRAKPVEDRSFRWSRYASQLTHKRLGGFGTPLYRPFQPGFPALDAFPCEVWTRLLSQLRTSATLYGYGSAQGFLPLRKAIASYLNIARGVVCDPEQVVIVSGAQQALDLITRLLVNPGDAILVEEPGYLGAQAVFEVSGARLIGVQVDKQSNSLWEMPSRVAQARLAYLTPSNQFPVGGSMCVSRRLEWILWAKQSDGFIIEDDYDSEFRYDHRPLPALQSLDKYGRVIYVGTFSKVLFPALRLGYLVLPQDMVERFVIAKAVTDFHCPALEQAALARFMDEGHFGRHIGRMRTLYAERRSVICETLAKEVPGNVTVARPESGMHVIAMLPSNVDDVQVCSAAAEAGVSAMPLSACYMGSPVASGLLLGFAGYRPRQMQVAARRLALVLHHAVRPSLLALR